jgi:hypothetical protein
VPGRARAGFRGRGSPGQFRCTTTSSIPSLPSIEAWGSIHFRRGPGLIAPGERRPPPPPGFYSFPIQTILMHPDELQRSRSLAAQLYMFLPLSFSSPRLVQLQHRTASTSATPSRTNLPLHEFCSQPSPVACLTDGQEPLAPFNCLLSLCCSTYSRSSSSAVTSPQSAMCPAHSLLRFPICGRSRTQSRVTPNKRQLNCTGSMVRIIYILPSAPPDGPRQVRSHRPQ